MSEENDVGRRYWSANLRLMSACLAVWAFVSFGLGMLLRPLLSDIRVSGTDISFWFAMQGAVIVFVLLILVYAIGMNRLDHKYNVDED